MNTERIKGTWRDFLPLSAVLILGTILAICTFLTVRGYYATRDQQQFRRDAAYYSTSFRDNVDRHVTSLAAIRAFVSASRGMTRWEFSAFAHQILPQNSGFKAVLWVPSISKAGRISYEKQLQEDGLYGLRLREVTDQGTFINAGDRSFYLPVSFIEPFEGNTNLVGLDLSSNGPFSELFNSAKDSGQIAASIPLSHPLIAGVHGPVVLIAFPLTPAVTAKEEMSPAATPPEGYALGVLQLDRIIADTINSRTTSVQAVIAYRQPKQTNPFLLDGTARPPTMNSWFGDDSLHQTVPFDIANRHLILALRSAAQIDPLTSLYVPLGACLLVIALTSLLMQSMASTTLRKQMVERAVILRTAELNEVNETLRREVEQRRQAETALRIARDKAESANQAKSAFLATMSHELRTPLNAIIGFSSILAANNTGLDTSSLDHADEIHSNGERLLSLINDILDLTQMDHQDKFSSDDIVYLPDCIAVALGKSQEAATKAGITLKSAVPDQLPALNCDSKRLQRAVLHLLSNAIKFTPKGGLAGIAARLNADGTLVIQISDNGAGMPEGAEKRILELFSQYDGRLARQHEGIGLGLTYVSRVAQLHEARLDIASAPGKGTRISLIFPRNRIIRKLEVA